MRCAHPHRRDRLPFITARSRARAVKGLFSNATAVYIVLELANGGTLEDRLRNTGGSLPEIEAAGSFLQLASGALEMHKHHLRHGDLNLANIVVTKEGRCKLCDLGLTREVLPGQYEVKVWGTFEYMAPEMRTRPAAYNQSADVWALGIILFQMLAGKHPFEPPLTPAELIFPTDEPNTFRDSTRHLVQMMLNPKPSERPKLPEVHALASEWMKEIDDS